MLMREDIIIPLVKGKSVLHVGAAGTNLNNDMMRSNRWLHGSISSYARSLVALDIHENACNLMSEAGYNVICANAEDFFIENMFDVIVASEILEHLSNPGKALDCFRKHLCQDGKLIVSVPNMYCFPNQLRWQLSGQELVHHQHVCWYSEKTVCNILNRHGYNIEKVHYCNMYPQNGGSWKTYVKLFPLILRSQWRESIVCICSVEKHSQNDFFKNNKNNL